jgi:hypothetical protein
MPVEGIPQRDQVVTFTAPFLSYHPGEAAGFTPEEAQELADRGVAEAGPPPVGGEGGEGGEGPPPEPTPAILTGGAFDDAQLAQVVADIAAKGSAWAGFDIVVDELAQHSVRQQFAGVTRADDVCTLINAQLGPYATTTIPGDAAPWRFHITSNTIGATSLVAYPTVPLTKDDPDQMKRTEDISVMMRLTQVTGATIVQGTGT